MFCSATFYKSLLNLLTFAVKFIQRDRHEMGGSDFLAVLDEVVPEVGVEPTRF